MISEFFIEGRRVDISAGISSLLTFAIDDVKDFASRSTTFSKTIILPGTDNNNALFGNIFDTGISNDYDPTLNNIGYNFNASKSARCFLFQDNLQTFKGTVRLLEINKDQGNIEYEVALNGELTGLNVSLSSGYLTDLDFSAYNLAYNANNIAASWDNAPGSGVYFPLIDYGTYSVLKHDWDFKTFRPALYVKEYIDKMFAAANFRYTCALFNTNRFKSLIVPHNQKTLLSRVSQVLTANLVAPQIMIESINGNIESVAEWDSSLGGGFTYSAGVFTYTQAQALTTDVTFSLGGQRRSDGNGSFTINIRKNGVIVSTELVQTFTNPANIGYRWNRTVTLSLATGDTFDVFFQYVSGTEVYATVLDSSISIVSNVPSFQPVAYTQTITINDSIPQNIRQVDFLVSIVKLFNLYVYEDPFDERLILISPFIDFYSTSSGNAIDWTYKLNRDQPIRIKPLSELNSKIYDFNYRDDSDYYNDIYKKRYNRGYGSYTYDSQFEFASQTNKLELIFASTPLVGYQGEEKIYPTIFKRTGSDLAPVEENIDSVIRIMQSKKVSGVTPWQITNGGAALGSYDKYGYAGHFDDPDVPDNDLNFGTTQELFFVLATGNLTKTQFNLYWSGYMAEITDKDSKMLTAKFYLTPKDIYELDFAKYIIVDWVLFRLNKIIDYNASTPNDCTVELLKVINTSYSFPPVTAPVPGETFRILWDDGQALLYDVDKILYQ